MSHGVCMVVVAIRMRVHESRCTAVMLSRQLGRTGGLIGAPSSSRGPLWRFRGKRWRMAQDSGVSARISVATTPWTNCASLSGGSLWPRNWRQ